MGKVIFDITASLDGFVVGPNEGPENPWAMAGCACLTGISVNRDK